MITVSNVSVQFGKRVLFNDVNLKFICCSSSRRFAASCSSVNTGERFSSVISFP